MGSRGGAYDNAATGGFMATIKTELMSGVKFPKRHEARLAIFDNIESVCNRRRRHSALGNKNSLVFDQAHASLTSAEAGATSQRLSTKRWRYEYHPP
jgi:transposase InsO family protein